MVRLLWMSDNPTLTTGFARASRELINRISSNPDCALGCVGWYSDVIGKEPISDQCALYAGGWDFGKDSLSGAINDFEPDVIVGLGDLWMLESGSNVASKHELPFIGYFPVDGNLMSATWKLALQQLSYAATLSGHGLSEVSRLAPTLPCTVIPHGVNSALYSPYSREQRASIREDLYVGSRFLRSSLEDKFVIGCVARNQPRKQLPILFDAFAQFAQNRENAALLLHSSESESGWDLLGLIDYYNIANKTLLIRNMNGEDGLTDQEMASIYNCMDVFALPTMGEGFGLPLLEAMACGVPVVTTDWAAGADLVRGRGELVRTKDTVCTPPYNIEHAIADTHHLAHLLERFYNEPDLREECGKRGREFAETLTWDSAANLWCRMVTEVAINGKSGVRTTGGFATSGMDPNRQTRPVVKLLEAP